MIILRQKKYSKFSDFIEKAVGFRDKSYEEYKPKSIKEIIARSIKRKGKGILIKKPNPKLVMS